MKIIPKAQRGRPLVSDNTRVTKPKLPIIKKDKYEIGKFFITNPDTKKIILIRPTYSTVKSDNRSTYLKKQDLKKSLKLHELYRKDKELKEGAEKILGFLTFMSPSTYIGPVFNNNGKSYAENVMSGEGTGDVAGNVAVDMLTPFAIGGITKGILAGNRLYRIRLLSKAIDNSSPALLLIPLNVGWGPKQTIPVSHASNTGDMLLFFPKRWDVVNEGANPHGIWYQGKLGTPRTNLTNPGKGDKAGADGLVYNGVYDNGYNNNLVNLSFKRMNNPNSFASINSNEIDNIPIGLKTVKVNREIKLDLDKMNLYHIQNVLEYNINTGNNISPILFTSEPGASTKIFLTNLDFNDYVKLIKTNSPSSDVENIGGIFNSNDNTVYLRPTASSSNIYHEHLHLNKYGITNPEVTRWRINQLVDPDKTKHMSESAKHYFLSEEEAPVHLRLLGRDYGIKVGDPYPGDDVFDLLTLNKIGGSSYYMRRSTPDEKRLLWRGFNGTLFGVSIPLTIGISTLR